MIGGSVAFLAEACSTREEGRGARREGVCLHVVSPRPALSSGIERGSIHIASKSS